MKTTTMNRALALAAGLAATGGALAILLADPVTTGHWRLDHAILPLVVGLTVLSGHLVGSATCERRWLAGLGFGAIFIIGTALTVYSSVGAQKSGNAAKIAEVNTANEAVRDLRAQKVRAERALAGHQADAQRLAGVRSTSEVRAAMDTAKVPAWAWRDSKQCTDAEALADAKTRAACAPILALRQEMARAIEAGEVARKLGDAEVKISALADELHALGGEKVAASKSGPFADALGVLGLDRNKVELIVSTFEPFAYSLLFELTAIVAFGFAFAHRGNCGSVGNPGEVGATVAGTVSTSASNDDLPLPPKGGNRRTVASRAAAEADIVRLVARGEELPSQGTLAARWGAHKATVSKWLADFERRGIVTRTTAGRCKRIARAVA